MTSVGGHFAEVRSIARALEGYRVHYVLNERIALPPELKSCTTFITHAERDWRVALNLAEGLRLLTKLQPRLLLSAGAGPAVPFALVAKLLDIPFVYLESSAQVTEPSLTGRIMYHLTEHFFFQWASLERYFPDAECCPFLT